MATIRWGIIGCGDVTEVKSGPAFQRADNSSLVAVMRRTGALAEDFARRHGVPRWHDDADAIIHADDIDAVYVATHPNSHREYVLRCAEAGKPVYVEKPMAIDHDECLEMIAACRSAGVALWVGYYRRELPRFTAVEKLLGEGAIGEIHAVRTERYARPSGSTGGPAPWQLDPTLSKGGVFFDSACHTLDFLDLLFGPVVDVGGETANRSRANDVVDTICATFRYENGVLGSGLWCYASDGDEDTTVIVGSKGQLAFSTSKPSPVRLVRDGEQREIPIDDPPHVHQPLVQTIVDELNGRGRSRSTGESGARTAWVMDQLLGSQARR
jgi:1,5-anhydro-D-fructose reductase (1,5-anhydro-D-mannitol-forming)